MNFGDCDVMIVVFCLVVDYGVNFFDIVEVYGFYVNEEFVGEVFELFCDEVVIVMKFGWDICDG